MATRLRPLGTPGHLLGTDEQGRDIWARLLYGGRLSLLTGIVPVMAATTIGAAIEAELAPYTGATGKQTTLHDTVFTTIPGSPAYPGKAGKYVVNAAKYGFTIDLKDHNAVQGNFRFVA